MASVFIAIRTRAIADILSTTFCISVANNVCCFLDNPSALRIALANLAYTFSLTSFALSSVVFWGLLLLCSSCSSALCGPFFFLGTHPVKSARTLGGHGLPANSLDLVRIKSAEGRSNCSIPQYL